MKPILYESRETDFNHNGLGKMSETLSAIVTEVANGEFELEVVYPIGGRLYKYIQDHMLIKAKPNSVDDPHVFRIYEHTVDTVEQTVTIHAHTKSNDLGLNLVKDVVINSLTPQEAMNLMKMNLVEPTDYSFVSDITTRSSTEWNNRNPLNCIAGEEGSLIQYWGGEIKRDNRTIYLYRRRGNDKVAVIREGKDLGGVSIEYSTKGMVTKIIPFRTYTLEDSENEITEYGTPVESQYVGNYPIKYIAAVDYSNEDDVTNLQTMNTKASRYFTENNGIDKPNINVNVNLVELSESPEYEKFKDLENKQLFDTLTIYSKKYDINIEAKVNTLVYDSLGEKNISLDMGSYKTGLMESTERTYKDLLAEREAQITNVIQRTANGKNRIFRGVDEPTTGMVKNDLWYKPVGDGETEMYQFDGAYWQLILSTLDITKVQQEVEAALSEAESAKQTAENAYSDAVTEAERLVDEQAVTFDAEMNIRKGEITDVQNNITAELDRVEQAISANFTSLSDSIDDVDAISKQAKSDAQTAISNASTAASNAATALSNASTALSNSQTAISTASSANDKAIKSSVIEWVLSTSGTTPPTTGWSTTIPTPSTTQYTWGRTTITLNDGTTILSYNVSKIGVKGDAGAPGAGGAKGDKGDAGVNAPKITAVTQQFYLSSSNTSQTGGSWAETIPVWSIGKYYWTRVVTSYDNATTTPSVAVLDNSLNQSLVTALEAKSATQTLSTTVSQHATQIAAKAAQTTVDSLTGRVTTAEGTINVQAGQIALKANQTTVDTLTGRVGTAETNISANTTAINLRATKTSVDSLTGRVTTAEGTITTQAGHIALRATTATVNALTGRVSAAESSLVVQSGKIDLAATKTELTTAIDGIQVGGRNLLRGTSNDWIELHLPATQTYRNIDFLETRLEVGETYTFSIEVEKVSTDTNPLQLHLGVGTTTYQKDLVNWRRNSVTFGERTILTYTIKEGDLGTFVGIFAFRFLNYNKEITLRYRNLQLEKGNKTTDWTPAPEDVDASIAAVQSNLTVEAGKITALTTRVSGAESNITNVTQTVSGINTTISTLRTDVNGKATIVSLNEVKSTADGNKTTITNHAGRLTTVETNVNGLQTTVASKAAQSQVTQLANGLSSVVTDLSNVDVISQSGVVGKTFRNAHTFQDRTASRNGMVRINTPITNSAMTTIRFTGYNYQGNRSTIDLTVSFYAYTASSILQHSYTNRGDFEITNVQVGRDSSGRAVILLGAPTTNWQYPTIDIEYVNISYTTPPDSWKDGWSSSITTDTTGITALTTLQGMDTQSRITQNATDINLRVTKGDVVSQLNIDAGQVLIQTNKLLLDANTYIMGTTFVTDLKAKSIEAVTANITSIRSQLLVADSITSTHVKTEAALVNKIFATDAMVTTLTGKTAFINSIKAIDISADKITTGSLNAANVNIINLNTSSIVGLNSNFVTSMWNTGAAGSVTISASGVVTQVGSLATSLNAGYLYTVSGSKTGRVDANGLEISNTTTGQTTRTHADGLDFDWYGIKRQIVQNSEGLTIKALTGSGNRLNSALYLETGTGVDKTAYLQLSIPDAVSHARLQLQNKVLSLRHPVEGQLSIADYNFDENKGLIRSGKFRTSPYDGQYLEMAERQIQTSRSGNQNIFIIPAGTGGLRVGAGGAAGQLWPVTALSFVEGSSRASKTNIAEYTQSALPIINSLKVTEYNLKVELARGINRRKIGFIAEDSPDIAVNQPGTTELGVDHYRMTALAIKAIQETSDMVINNGLKITRIDTYVTQHELEIKNLKERIKQLEEKIV